MQHSIRVYENTPSLHHTTEIVNIVAQSVKIINDGKPSMVDVIGLVLKETIFHPQGGGQPADKGTLNGIAVLTAREDRSLATERALPIIYHYIDSQAISPNHFRIGQKVELTIDSEHRLQCMRSHSAGHLIADVLEKNPEFADYEPKATHGNHFPSAEYIKVLIAHDPSNMEQLCTEINLGLESLISADLSISTFSNENKLRHVAIGDSPRMCGGTHVTSSLELKGAKVIKVKNSKNKDGQSELTVFYTC